MLAVPRDLVATTTLRSRASIRLSVVPLVLPLSFVVRVLKLGKQLRLGL